MGKKNILGQPPGKSSKDGVVTETAIWQYMWYGKSSFQVYNDVDRAFYESINYCNSCYFSKDDA